MELINDFRVGVPVSDAWSVLTDVERIAPLLPGAQLQEIDGDEYRGVVKVKVGPITAQYKGTAFFAERDEADGRVVLQCNGRDTRGQGNANATITAVMKPDGDGTLVTVTTDLTVTGKVAQFGRGVLADISAKLMGQFVDALEADLRDNGATPTPVAAEAQPTEGPSVEAPSTEAEGPSTNGTVPAQPATVGAPGATQAVGEGDRSSAPSGSDATVEIPASAPSAPTKARKINQPEPEPVDLFEAAGGSVAKRLVPVVVLVALLVVVFLRRRAGKHRK